MDHLWGLAEFAGKALLVFLTFVACVGVVATQLRMRRSTEPVVRLVEVSERWRRNVASLGAALEFAHQPKRMLRRAPKPKLVAERPEARVFVLDFKGDVLASETEGLREEITVLSGIARPGDEVVLRLESGGGAVHSYGLAASQLARLKQKSIPLTVCVDKIAASGGYMMACVGQKILAAPFAVVGSIGVVAPVPNAHRLIEKLGIDYQDVTAGEHKRPVSLFGTITDEGRAKLQDQIDETHELFKRFVVDMRPGLDIESVATGEHWYGSRAVELGLVDELRTSDDYLLSRAQDARILELVCDRPRRLRERAASLAQSLLAILR
jgi:serine protease SohB